MAKVLIIDDEPGVCWALRKTLEEAGHETIVAGTAEQGLPLASDAELIFLDIGLPGMDGLKALERLDGIPVVIITAHGTLENAVEALQKGAFDYLVKPLRSEEIPALVQRAVRRAELEREVTELRRQLGARGPTSPLKGTTRSMQDVFKQVATVALSDAGVLIRGESGTGKELVARTIHESSRRKAGPFEPIDCGALPEPLVESELFGYEKGAFTGAVARKPGRIERADGGTLFLDEVGELPASSQAKLLRFLAEREIVRVGGGERIPIDVRIVAASNRDLRQEVEAGRFRQDLFYRLAVTEIRLPPLRTRVQDVALLVAHFLQSEFDYAGEVSADAMKVLEAYDWPGNVRELRNAIEAATVTARGGAILADHLPTSVRQVLEAAPDDVGRIVKRIAGRAEDGQKFEAVQGAFEHALLEQALQETGGNQLQAARRLGIHRTTLRKLMDKHGL